MAAGRKRGERHSQLLQDLALLGRGCAQKLGGCSRLLGRGSQFFSNLAFRFRPHATRLVVTAVAFGGLAYPLRILALPLGGLAALLRGLGDFLVDRTLFGCGIVVDVASLRHAPAHAGIHYEVRTRYQRAATSAAKHSE